MEYYKKYEPIFDAWYITRLIGEGSFGKVFEIERTDFGKTYRAAMKAITIPQNSSDIKNLTMSGMDNESVTTYFNSLVENVANEFVLMSKMKGNSNIVSYEDHKVIRHEDGIGWDILIRMELLTPADDFFSRNGFEINEIIKLGIDLCEALEVCKKHSIIHRDIKPSNIFVSDNGDFKLGDFGVAKTIEQTTGEFSKKGTYNYMAPEIYKGEVYGNSVDIYSVGIVMYRYLNNNRTPFLPQPPEMITYNKSEEALTRRMRGEELPPPVNASKELARIILKACSFEPENRYSSPAQLRRELENLFTDSEPQTDFFDPTIYQSPVDKFEETAKPISKPSKNFAINIPDEFDTSISDKSGETNQVNNGGKNKTAIICVACAVILALIIGGAFLFKNSFFASDLRSFFSNLLSSTMNVEETTENSNISTTMFEFSDLLNTDYATTLESTTQVMFVKTAGSDLNMREQADINSAVVAKIPSGYPVYVLRAEAEWTYIEYGYQNGWVKNEFLVDVDELEESTTVKVAFTTQPVRSTIVPTTRKPTTTRKTITTQKPITTKATTTKRVTTTIDSLSNYDYVNEWANLKIDLPYGYTDQTEYYQNTYNDELVDFYAVNLNKASNFIITLSPFDIDDIDNITTEQALYMLSSQYMNDVGENNIQNSSEIFYTQFGNEEYSCIQFEDHSYDTVIYVRYCLKRIGNKYLCIVFSTAYKSEFNTMGSSIDSIS